MNKLAKILLFLDEWGTTALVFLIPWQARFIVSQGYLAGGPSEAKTVSIFIFEIFLALVLAVRFFNLAGGRQKYAMRVVGRTFAAFGALVFLSLFSVVVSFDRGATLIVSLRLLEALALFFVIITAPSERKARAAFIAAAAVQSGIAILELALGSVWGSTLLGMSPERALEPGASVVETGSMRLLRAYGTLPHPNILGGMMAAAILLARSLFKKTSIYSAAVYVALTAGLFLSFSRLAWAGLFFGLVAQYIFARRDRFFIAHAGVVAAVFLMLTGLFFPFVESRTMLEGRLERKSVSARAESLEDAYKLVKIRPLAGVGAGAFTQAVFERLDPDRGPYGYEPAHSVFMNVFAELGVFGLALAFILLFNLAKLAWGSGKPGLAIALIVIASGEHWPVTTFADIMIFFAAWALSIRGGFDGKITHKAGAVILSNKNPDNALLLYRAGLNYSDWTFPKGHLEMGESYEDAMRREVWEETGLVVDIIKRLPNREYVTGHGHDSVVHFFLVRSLDDSKLRVEEGYFDNKLEWVPVDEIASRLTFENLSEYFQTALPEIKNRVSRAF